MDWPIRYPVFKPHLQRTDSTEKTTAMTEHRAIPDRVIQRWNALIHEIHIQDQAYYQHQEPILSDAEYDALRQELAQLEEAYPTLVTPESPSHHVGYQPSALFAHVAHLWPVYSLEKVMDFQGFQAFSEKAVRFLGLEKWHAFTWVAEPKIDGLTVILRYKQGILVRAATRGNGAVGEDVTANVRTIPSIPHVLTHYDGPPELEVRGEVYILQDDFQQWNADRQGLGLPRLSNPRNAAAGSLRQLDSSITASRPLWFMPHGSTLSDDLYPGIDTYQGMMARLKIWGFPGQKWAVACADDAAIQDYFKAMTAKRPHLNYEIDGIVYKMDRLSDQKRLGHSARAPRYAVAAKFPSHDAITHILDIQVQIGRTGVVTPVAHVQPVLVGGVTVTRASIHNANEIMRKDIRMGDQVVLRRAGDVIPQILYVVQDQRSPDSRPYVFPTHCPSCGTILVRKEGAVAWKCMAGFSCAAQAVGRLRHCVSREGLDVAGLGIRQLTFLHQKNLVHTPADLFRLTLENLKDLEGWGEKSATQVLEAIAARTTVSLHRWIYALGIPSVGYVTAKALADHYKDRTHLEEALLHAKNPDSPQAQELLNVSGVGQDVAHELSDFIQFEQDWVDDLATYVAIETGIEAKKSTDTGSPLYGKTVVFTGTLPSMTRAEAKERAEQCGARVLSGLSQNVDFLVAGEKSGRKIDQAKAWNVTILDASLWDRMIEE